MIRRIFIFLIVCMGLCLLGLGVVGAAYGIVAWKSAPMLYDDVDAIPYNRVGLVLGTNPKSKGGKTNYYYKYRIEACAKLYKEGKISKILVSGDNHNKEYDEPSWMKQSLIEEGVLASDIVLDYAGFRTLDSVVRCKEVFGQTKFTIITQEFHNERAVFMASMYGIDAVGFNAKELKRTKTYYIFGVGREALARVKMFIDIIFKKQPKFLGEKITI